MQLIESLLWQAVFVNKAQHTRTDLPFERPDKQIKKERANRVLKDVEIG